MQNYRIKKTYSKRIRDQVYVPQIKKLWFWACFYKNSFDTEQIEYTDLSGAVRFVEDMQRDEQLENQRTHYIKIIKNKKPEYLYPPFPLTDTNLDANGLPSHEEMQKGGICIYDKGTMV